MSDPSSESPATETTPPAAAPSLEPATEPASEPAATPAAAPSVAPAANPAPPTPPSADKVLQPQKEQRANRAENQDYMRVLQLFSGGMLPLSYLEHLNAAGDVIFNVGQSGTTAVAPRNRDSAEVAPGEIRLIRQVYQRHGGYAAALSALRDMRCVVLRGKPQIGKRSAAVRLATEVRSDKLFLWELSPEEDLAEQTLTSALKPGTTYLIDGLLRERGRKLTRLQASNLLGNLAALDCYLIICAQPAVVLPAELRSVALEPLAQEQLSVALEEHLGYYGPLDADQMQLVLTHAAVAELLKKGLPPGQINQLAAQLAQELKDGASIEIALRGYAASAEREIQGWFDQTADDIDESAFRVALAVFNGARYISVIEAARDLAEQLQPKTEQASAGKDKEQGAAAPVSPFRKKRTPRLEAARGKLVMRREVTEYSDHAQIEVVELEDEGYSPALLKYVWTEFDDLRQPLLDWLCAHAVSGPYDMRLRAAGALGALAGLDFDYLRARVFRPWAFTDAEDSDLRRARYQALGNALGVLVWNDTHAEDVLGLLADWATDSRDALRWAAARAYAQVGLRYPREAMHQWRRILESKGKLVFRLTADFGISMPHPLHMSVVDAIVTLFLRAVELPHRLRPVYEQALEGLAAWVEADAKDRQAEQVGLPLFLALTAVRLPPEDSSGEPDDWPPAMLTIIGTQSDSSYRRALAGMWRRALNHPEHGRLAAAALQFWTTCAERDQRLLPTLVALLRELLALPGVGERERGRLYMLLTRWWRLPGKDQLAVAEQLRNELGLVG